MSEQPNGPRGEITREEMIDWWMSEHDRISAEQIAKGGKPLVERGELLDALQGLDYWNMRHTYNVMRRDDA